MHYNNMIAYVDAIKDEMDRGMPDGMDQDFLRKIPFLLKRIEELETALVPFGRAYTYNEAYKDEMVQVYKEDCNRAFQMLDSRRSIKIPKPLPEIPA